MATYQYSLLPDRKHIRALKILPSADKHAAIDCTIGAVLVTEYANYTALSYTWGIDEDGDTSPRGQLYISSKVLPITPNIYQGLLRTWEQTTSVHFWIDAVCINQETLYLNEGPRS